MTTPAPMSVADLLATLDEVTSLDDVEVLADKMRRITVDAEQRDAVRSSFTRLAFTYGLDVDQAEAIVSLMPLAASARTVHPVEQEGAIPVGGA